MTLSKHQIKMLALANKNNNKSLQEPEGKWKMSFTLGGRTYTKSHVFNPGEIKHMKDLCIEFGDEAANQIIWRAAIKGIEIASQRLILEAAIDFIKLNTDHTIGNIEAEKAQEVGYKELLQQGAEDYIASKAPLPDEKAFDAEAGEQIRQQEQEL